MIKVANLSKLRFSEVWGQWKAIFFTPHQDGILVGGYPRSHLRFGQIQVSNENFATDNLTTCQSPEARGQLKTLFWLPPSGWDICGGTQRVTQCEYQAKISRQLKIHQRNVHEGIRYACHLCNHKATRKGNLKIHIESQQHEGKK